MAPNEVPDQIDRWSITEVLEPVEGGGWRRDYFDLVRQLERVDEGCLQKIYPKGNEHNMVRAQLLVDGGNFLIKTLRYRFCLDSQTRKRRVVFEISCIPSQKTKVISENIKKRTKVEGYTSYLCFNCDETEGGKRLLEYPNSCCGCYDGRVFCSHLTGLLLLFYLIQTSEYSKEEFEKDLPEAAHEGQHIPMLMENMLREDAWARSEAQRKRRRTC